MYESRTLSRNTISRQNGNAKPSYDCHKPNDVVYPLPHKQCTCAMNKERYTASPSAYQLTAKHEKAEEKSRENDLDFEGSPDMTSSRAARVCPRGPRTWFAIVTFVMIPMGALIGGSSFWLLEARKELEWLNQRNQYVEQHLMQLVKLVIAFNYERECAALFVTSRDDYSEGEAFHFLNKARQTTDSAIQALAYSWPGRAEDGYMYKSSILFQAVLQRHRETMQVGTDFKDQVAFYTDIIYTVCSWYFRDALIWKETRIWPYILSYSYLLGSINLIGAEQMMCSVYHAIICFSHKETFLYSNYSFSGEAMFKMYHHSYPGNKDHSWKSQSHSEVFPNLHMCRIEILADVNYPGVGIDPTMCDFSRKNETRFDDLDILLYTENNKLTNHIRTEMASEHHEAYKKMLFSFMILASIVIYFIIMHLIRCSFIKCKQAHERFKYRSSKDALNEEDKLAHIALNENPTVIGYDDYRDYDGSTSTAYIKVATV